MRHLVFVAVLLLGAVALADAVRIVEKLPRTEQIESGQVKLNQVSDRQLVALMLDLVKRAEFDRSQHNGGPGPDASYLKQWIARVMAEMDARKMSADGEGLLDVPADR